MRELEGAPDRQRLYYREFRRVMTRRFPCKIFYQIIGDRIVVLRVLHARQERPENL